MPGALAVVTTWAANRARLDTRAPLRLVPPADVFVDVEDFVTRAHAHVDTGRYRLGGGVDDPDARTPLDLEGEIDCSQWLLWLWRRRKHLPGDLRCAGYGQINTTAMYADAKGKREFFVEVPIGTEVQVGDGLVYPGLYDGGVRLMAGHCGGIIGIRPGWFYRNTASLAYLTVSHANAGVPPAIDETNGGPWAKHGIVVRLRRRW